MVDTVVINDYRRTDIRRNTLENPYWISSGQITKVDDDLNALLFSFPITASLFSPGYKPFYIEQVLFEVETLFAGGTITIYVGRCNLATDIITTGGVGVIDDMDEYFETADITSGTVGYYPVQASAWLNAKIAQDGVAPYIVTPADTSVPAIYCLLASDAAITAGAGRVHVQINEP